MVTRQRVGGALRAAGIQAARWHASRQVRGWGDWVQGVRAVQDAERIQVWWQDGRWAEPTPALCRERLERVTLALKAKEIAFIVEGDWNDWVVSIPRNPGGTNG